jgi:hypothetical protein
LIRAISASITTRRMPEKPRLRLLTLSTMISAPGVADRLADAGGVGQHQRALEVFQVFAGDAGRGQQAETGVDAVGGAVLGEDLFHAATLASIWAEALWSRVSFTGC